MNLEFITVQEEQEKREEPQGETNPLEVPNPKEGVKSASPSPPVPLWVSLALCKDGRACFFYCSLPAQFLFPSGIYSCLLSRHPQAPKCSYFREAADPIVARCWAKHLPALSPFILMTVRLRVAGGWLVPKSIMPLEKKSKDTRLVWLSGLSTSL